MFEIKSFTCSPAIDHLDWPRRFARGLRLTSLLSALFVTQGALTFAHELEPQLQLSLPALSGDGCEPDSASAALSPDGCELSVFFDRFTAEAGGTSGKRHDRKTCNIDVGIQVPLGYEVALVSVDYRGYQSAPPTAQTQVAVNYSFNNRPGSRFLQRYVGPTDQEFTVSQLLSTREAGAWTACGAATVLRLTASVLTTTNGKNEQAIATIDSADMAGGVSYRVAYRHCERAMPLPPSRPPRVVPGGGPRHRPPPR